jgi:YHS domain-containing protein
MNADEANGQQLEWGSCVVCGGSIEPEGSAAQINHRGNTINLCGPQCLRAFAEQPDAYLARLAKIMRDRATKTEIPCL